jgi:hypothetical protein
MQFNPDHSGTPLHFKAMAKRALGEHAEAILLWDRLITEFSGDRHWPTAWKEKAYTQWAFLDQFHKLLKHCSIMLPYHLQPQTQLISSFRLGASTNATTSFRRPQPPGNA